MRLVYGKLLRYSDFLIKYAGILKGLDPTRLDRIIRILTKGMYGNLLVDPENNVYYESIPDIKVAIKLVSGYRYTIVNDDGTQDTITNRDVDSIDTYNALTALMPIELPGNPVVFIGRTHIVVGNEIVITAPQRLEGYHSQYCKLGYDDGREYICIP